MSSLWNRIILPAIITTLFSVFLIPLYLILIAFSRFLRRELQKLIKKYGREDVVKVTLMSNIKGLFDLFIRERREKRAALT